MTLKEEFNKKFEGKSYDTDDIWAWMEDKLKEERSEERDICFHRLRTVRWWLDKEREEAIDDAIDWFGEELDRLVRTKQIDMIHTNIDKIILDAENELKEKK